MALLKSKLTLMADQMDSSVAAELENTATMILSHIRLLSPVETGLLRSSYKVLYLSETHLQIGTDVEYGKYQEFGTFRMAANPHLSPAFVLAGVGLRSRMAVRISQMAKEVRGTVGSYDRKTFVDPFGGGN